MTICFILVFDSWGLIQIKRPFIMLNFLHIYSTDEGIITRECLPHMVSQLLGLGKRRYVCPSLETDIRIKWGILHVSPSLQTHFGGPALSYFFRLNISSRDSLPNTPKGKKINAQTQFWNPVQNFSGSWEYSAHVCMCEIVCVCVFPCFNISQLYCIWKHLEKHAWETGFTC